MLRKVLFVSMTALILFSCKKEKNESAAYHLTAKFNGTQVNFSASLAAEKYLDPSNGYTISVLGMGGSTSNPLPSFDFIIHSDSEITTKTYSESTDAMLVSYTDSNSDTYDEGDQFVITISSITDTEVRGTFSGKMIKSGSLEVVNVTEGSFKAKIY
jgi:hypothetical protein